MPLTSYPEPLVARVVGVKKARLVSTRHGQLAKGEDWSTERNVVCYTQAGLEKLLGALGLAAASFTWPEPGEGQVVGSATETAGGAADGAAEASGELDDEAEGDEDDEGLEDDAEEEDAAAEKITLAPPVAPTLPPLEEPVVLSEPTPAPAREKILGVGERAAQRWPWPQSAAAAVAVEVEQIQQSAPVELIVSRVLHNPSLLEAKHPTGETVRVRVRTNVNFIRGMKLKARQPGPLESQRVWSLVGHCPRWRGRY